MPGSLGASQGIALSFTRPTPTTLRHHRHATPCPAFGGWFQIAARPIEALQIYGGWGGTQSPFDAYAGTVFDATPRRGTRLQNFMWAAGRHRLRREELALLRRVRPVDQLLPERLSYTQGQFSINSQLTF